MFSAIAWAVGSPVDGKIKSISGMTKILNKWIPNISLLKVILNWKTDFIREISTQVATGMDIGNSQTTPTANMLRLPIRVALSLET